MTSHLLSVLLFLPVAGMLVLLLFPESKSSLMKGWTLLVSALTLVVSLVLLSSFKPGVKGFQFEERASWIPSIGVQYLLGVDGISLLLVLLTTLISLLAVVCSWSSIHERLKLYCAMLLLLESSLLGVFLSLDLFLFYIFWDLVLVPMYFIIGIYGGPRRSYASIKFFLYTLLGSVFMLLGFIMLYFQYGQQTGSYTFELTRLMQVQMPLHMELWIFLAFFLGFAVKIPMFPFHTWLPDAHVEAPTAGSVLLASLMLKMGTYGFIRFSLNLLPNASTTGWVVNTMAALSLVAILYGALVCLTQTDWKKLVAYSSISHLGFCTLGIFALNQTGIAGSVIQQVNHGISTGLLFLLVGFMYERRHTREISEFGGLAQVAPMFATVFAITVFSSAGLPLLNGFIGEFSILSGAFHANPWWAFGGVLGLILSAAYLLWLYQRTMLGPIRHEVNRTVSDLTLREKAIVLPLIALVFAIGLYPAPLFTLLERPVSELVLRIQPNAGTHASTVQQK